jgi:hypothetical protein
MRHNHWFWNSRAFDLVAGFAVWLSTWTWQKQYNRNH